MKRNGEGQLMHTVTETLETRLTNAPSRNIGQDLQPEPGASRAVGMVGFPSEDTGREALIGSFMSLPGLM